MRLLNNSIKFYVTSILFVLGGVALFFYLGLSGFCIHISQIENLIPEEDEPLVLVLFGMGTAILELAIYCIDSDMYAQKQRLANLRRQRLLQEYRTVVDLKDKKIQLLLQQLTQLMQQKIDNARDLCAISEVTERREREMKERIKQLQSSIREISKQSEELGYKFSDINFVAEASKKKNASLKRTDVCIQLRKNAKSNIKAEHQQFVELEREINHLYPGFSVSLSEFFPRLSDRQLDLCLLMKAGFSTVEIANLLCLHYSSVSHMKSRLFKSLEVDGVTDLNDFLTKL